MLAVLGLLVIVLPLHSQEDEGTDASALDELRGVWISNVDCTVLDSRENIRSALRDLSEAGFNVVFPVVWNKGRTQYPSALMKKTFGAEIEERFRGRDPLQEMIEEAHALDIAVVPWFEYGFVGSYDGKGKDPLKRKPKWAGTDAQGGKLVKNGFRWMDALDPEVQAFVSGLVLEVVRDYDVDGVQGDDRLPAMPSEGGYDRETRRAYEKETGEKVPDDGKDAEWLAWRAARLTDFLRDLRERVHAVKPGLPISSSPTPPGWGLREYLQDSGTWLKEGLVDMIHPQAYRRDIASYEATMASILDQHYGRPAAPELTPGILVKSGSYRITREHLLAAIAWNRENGIKGEVLFHYQGLRENEDELLRALREGPYSERARSFRYQSR